MYSFFRTPMKGKELKYRETFYQCKSSRRTVWIRALVFSSKVLRFFIHSWDFLLDNFSISKDHLFKICISIFLWQKWHQMYRHWVQPLHLETLGLGFKAEEPLSRDLWSGGRGERRRVALRLSLLSASGFIWMLNPVAVPLISAG